MTKIERAVEIFLQREHQEYKAEIPHFINALKASIISTSCPSAYGLKDSAKCVIGDEIGCEKCFNEEVEE